MAQNLQNFFEKFLKKESLFINKKVLQSSYFPEEVFHRDEQINKIAQILAPALRLERPSNLFMYGKTGTGKTLSVKHTLNQITEVAQKREIPVKTIYINCKLKKIADTEYRLIAELARFFGKAIPPTGLPTDEVYNAFFKELDSKKQVVILVLDEIDQLVKRAGDQIIYNLTRVNADLALGHLTLVGISNDLTFADNLDPRVKSSLSEEEIVFPPYNALQIQDILTKRSTMAFKENVLEDGLIQKCSAYAAREHGDVRRALELLRVSGELAERKDATIISITDLDEAEEKIERDRFVDVVETQPKQFQAVLYSIMLMHEKRNKGLFTGEVYDVYKKICVQTSLRPLTQRRVSDVIAELDMLGIIQAKVISKGRYGRTKELILALPKPLEEKIKIILEESLHLR
jgi:archaeal cell division control protein 6